MKYVIARNQRRRWVMVTPTLSERMVTYSDFCRQLCPSKLSSDAGLFITERIQPRRNPEQTTCSHPERLAATLSEEALAASFGGPRQNVGELSGRGCQTGLGRRMGNPGRWAFPGSPFSHRPWPYRLSLGAGL